MIRLLHETENRSLQENPRACPLAWLEVVVVVVVVVVVEEMLI